MNPRRTHSSIDKLPRTLQRALEGMLIDNAWPDDCENKRKDEGGNPRYVDLELYCSQHGCDISSSAVGRWAKGLQIIAIMKQKSEMVRTVMENSTDESASQTQKAVGELLTARAIDLAVSDKALTSKQIKEIAQGIRDCANISIKADQYQQQQLKQKAVEANKNIKNLVGKKKLSPETLKIIREQIYGIFN